MLHIFNNNTYYSHFRTAYKHMLIHKTSTSKGELILYYPPTCMPLTCFKFNFKWYTFCIQKLYKMYTTDVYKMYKKCIPHFDKHLYTFCILYKIKKTMAPKFCIQKFVEMWDTFCIHFVYINSDLQKMYTIKIMYHTICIQNSYIIYTEIIVYKMDPTFQHILTHLLSTS